ncbi:hypothetical protein [Paenibacillus sp. FSL H7-0714]|uniref:hypothetical protein n=1 Tax=Paenibacillus sp. FSL H7-0714 TaxID=2954735 RepID=UPI0030FB3D49
MAWTVPNLNWTAADYYNHADMSRVEINTKAVQDLMASKGFAVTIQEGVYSRNIWWVPFKEEFTRIEANLEALRKRYTPVGWRTRDLPWTADSPFSYIDANRWENNLNLLWKYYSGL